MPTVLPSLRRRRGERLGVGVDPLRLDLHLSPGRGTLPLAEVAPLLADIEAPIVLEVHPPNRPTPADLLATVRRSPLANDQG
jgi:sugar phosphate isomerase/epimerase